MERNVAAINELADFVESEKFKFNMTEASAEPACGSAGCIGGHAAVLWPEIRNYPEDEIFSWRDDLLALKLNITNGQQDNLCYPNNIPYRRITRSMAVAALRRLAATGEIRFDITDDNKKDAA